MQKILHSLINQVCVSDDYKMKREFLLVADIEQNQSYQFHPLQFLLFVHTNNFLMYKLAWLPPIHIVFEYHIFEIPKNNYETYVHFFDF